MQRTGLVGEVFRFSWEDRAWTAAQIIREVRGRLLGPVDQARADLMPPAAQLEQLAGLLRATRHLLILDNFESVTAAPAAIPHALGPAEQAQLRTLLTRLRGGKTLVLIGSRQDEAWLAPGTFGGNAYPLPGLDPQAASDLTNRILRRHDTEHWLENAAEREALNNLTGLLGGYPLPMTVVLPALATSPPSQVLAELQAGGQGADPARKIIAAIGYSHGRLDPALQEALLLLAPFTAVIPSGEMLANYRGFLVDDASAGLAGEPDLGRAVAEAVRVGLAVPHSQLRGWVQVQPVFPYFLRTRLRIAPPCARPSAAPTAIGLYSDLGLCWQPAVDHTLEIPAGQRKLGRQSPAEYAQPTTALPGPQATQLITGLIFPLAGVPAADRATGGTAHAAGRSSPSPAPRGTDRADRTLDPARPRRQNGSRGAPPSRRPGHRRNRAPAAAPAPEVGRAPHITSSARSRRSSGASRKPRPPTARPWTSSWSSGTGTPPPAPTTSSAGSRRSGRRPRS